MGCAAGVQNLANATEPYSTSRVPAPYRTRGCVVQCAEARALSLQQFVELVEFAQDELAQLTFIDTNAMSAHNNQRITPAILNMYHLVTDDTISIID